MAAACEKRDPGGRPWQDALEEKSSMAESDDWQRGGDFVGSLRSDEAENQSTRGDSEVLRMVRPQRGVQQHFKESIRSLQEVFASLKGACEMETRWVALEIFAGCCRFTQMATTREGWHALAPVDLSYIDGIWPQIGGIWFCILCAHPSFLAPSHPPTPLPCAVGRASLRLCLWSLHTHQWAMKTK